METVRDADSLGTVGIARSPDASLGRAPSVTANFAFTHDVGRSDSVGDPRGDDDQRAAGPQFGKITDVKAARPRTRKAAVGASRYYATPRGS